MRAIAATMAATAMGLALAGPARADGPYYEPTVDPPVDIISGHLINGTLSGVLPASDLPPLEDFVHIILHANAGDLITVDTNGSLADPALTISRDVAEDGIFVGDMPGPGLDLTMLAFDQDSGVGLNALVQFSAPYTGEYLASISETRGRFLAWTLNVTGSTFAAPGVPEPGAAALLGIGLLGVWLHRRAADHRRA